MLTAILARTAEPTVIKLTEDLIKRELSPISGAELATVKNWSEGVANCKTEFLCLLEADCLVSSGYFESMLGLFKKNPMYRQLGMLSSATGVVNWANRIYGYRLATNHSAGVVPVHLKASNQPYRTGIAYAPGAIIRTASLKRILKDTRKNHVIGSSIMRQSEDLVYFSTLMSLALWRIENHISINPNATYCTTEKYVGEPGIFDTDADDVIKVMERDL